MENSNNKEFDILDDLFARKLNSIERNKLFERMQWDKEFSDAYSYRLNMLAALKNNRAAEIKRMAAEWDKEERETLKTPIIGRRNWVKYAVAATILALVGITWFANQSDELDNNNLALFESHYMPAIVDIERNSSAELAYVYYANQEHDKAINEFKKLTSEEAKYFLANSFLAINEPIQAIATLNDYTGVKYKVEVQWLSALANLQNNNSTKAKVILQEMTQLKGAYGVKAKKLLSQL